ncbi:hypothetical protein ACGFW5_30395 [Streptomyces sp. NPDC048416]|uniref:hypothetical protein n=1 Tax=Streptomyces sp. NPDC048416 TaxID=3365546 RepID=UPI003720F07C
MVTVNTGVSAGDWRAVPRYVRVRIVTPEEEEAHGNAVAALVLFVLTVVLQTVGMFFLSSALKEKNLGHAALGAFGVLLAAWLGQLVDARGHQRPFKTRRFILSVCLSFALVLALPDPF